MTDARSPSELLREIRDQFAIYAARHSQKACEAMNIYQIAAQREKAADNAAWVDRIDAYLASQNEAQPAADNEALERKVERMRDALFRADREANGKRKDKAARISAICRQALTDTGEDHER